MSGRGNTAGRHRAGRHRTRRPVRARAIRAAGGTAALGVATAVALALINNGPATAGQPVAHTSATRPTPHPATSTSTSTSTPTPSPSSATTSPALTALRTLVGTRSAGSTSVAALDTVTGATASAGAGKGMTTASAVKLELLESLLLKRQRAGDDDLSSGELANATAMIEHSDNGAAEDVFVDVGGHDAVEDLEDDLGLSTTKTVLGVDDYWGLTTTSAAQQLVLLRNLIDPHGPLDAASRTLALSLMRNVEADQTWGVPAAATSGDPAVKNGWLAIDDDHDLWAVNSLGVVTVDGHRVLIAVMTQHNDSYGDGIARVERLARAAAAAVRS